MCAPGFEAHDLTRKRSMGSSRTAIVASRCSMQSSILSAPTSIFCDCQTISGHCPRWCAPLLLTKGPLNPSFRLALFAGDCVGREDCGGLGGRHDVTTSQYTRANIRVLCQFCGLKHASAVGFANPIRRGQDQSEYESAGDQESEATRHQGNAEAKAPAPASGQ